MEYEKETKIKSQEARKYIFKNLNDIADVKFPSGLSGIDKRAEKVDRYLCRACPVTHQGLHNVKGTIYGKSAL